MRILSTSTSEGNLFFNDDDEYRRDKTYTLRGWFVEVEPYVQAAHFYDGSTGKSTYLHLPLPWTYYLVIERRCHNPALSRFNARIVRKYGCRPTFATRQDDIIYELPMPNTYAGGIACNTMNERPATLPIETPDHMLAGRTISEFWDGMFLHHDDWSSSIEQLGRLTKAASAPVGAIFIAPYREWESWDLAKAAKLPWGSHEISSVKAFGDNTGFSCRFKGLDLQQEELV